MDVSYSSVFEILACKYILNVNTPFLLKASTDDRINTIFSIFLLSQTMHNAFPSHSISFRHVFFHHVVYLRYTASATQSSSVCKWACSSSALLLLLLQGGTYLWERLRDIQVGGKSQGLRGGGSECSDLWLWTNEKDNGDRGKWPVMRKWGWHVFFFEERSDL